MLVCVYLAIVTTISILPHPPRSISPAHLYLACVVAELLRLAVECVNVMTVPVIDAGAAEAEIFK
jgi:hypothetical protein